MREWGRFVRAVLSGRWKISALSWLGAIGTIVYVLSPIDVIPELFLPVVGYIDDLGVWGVMMLLVNREKARWAAARNATAIDI